MLIINNSSNVVVVVVVAAAAAVVVAVAVDPRLHYYYYYMDTLIRGQRTLAFACGNRKHLSGCLNAADVVCRFEGTCRYSLMLSGLNGPNSP